MNGSKRFFLWLAISAVIWLTIGAGFANLVMGAPHPGDPGYIPCPGDPAWVWEASVPRLTKAQKEEAEIMQINLRYGSRMAWRAAMSRAMLIKANWLANRLNLPIQRPIQESNIYTSDIGFAGFRVLNQYPSWIPETIYGTDIYNTNIPRLKRILALKFGIGGDLETSDFAFSFGNGQLIRLVRHNASHGERYADRLAEIMAAPHVHPPLPKTYEVYHIATNYLAAVDINLEMLEKSRLPHPVRQEEYQPNGASDSVPVYFVAWGTNYYAVDYLYHYWHTNEWHPAVTVEIGPRNELLEMYIGDPTFFRNPPTLMPSQTVWRLVHTPDPPPDQLLNPTVMREFLLTPEEAAGWMFTATNNPPYWAYQHHLIKDPEQFRELSNELNHLHSVLIPYKPGDDPVFDTNQP
jgi:hypothetical protein